MKTITIRNVDPELAAALKGAKASSGGSLNKTVLTLLRRALGIDEERARFSNGLAAMAGGWTEEDLIEFQAATAAFSEIDEDLWR